MLRQLLTLLAVFFGFGLVAAPAQAVEVSQISVAISGDFEDCKATVGPVLQAHALRLGEVADPAPCRKKWIIVAAPTVMLRVDRAHE